MVRWLKVLSFTALLVSALYLGQHDGRTVQAQEITTQNEKLAQVQSCELVVQQALAAALDVCNDLGRGMACYVNTLAEAQSKEDVPALQFDTPGNTAAISDISTLKLSPYDEQEKTWGVVMLRAQANLPGVNIGQAVTMLAFGDTQIADAKGDGTLRAVYLKTGAGAPGCAAMPRNGVLLQTPKGGQTVEMDVNGVQLKIGSTVFLTAEGDEDELAPTLWVYTLEGSVEMTSDGVTVTVPQGTQNCVPLRDDDPDDIEVVENGPPCSPTSEPLDEELEAVLVDAVDTITVLGSDELATATPSATPRQIRRPPSATPYVEPTITGIPTPMPPPPSQTPVYVPASCVIVSFTAEPSVVTNGDVTVTLSWSTMDAVSVEVLYPGGDSFFAEPSGNYSYTFFEYGLQSQTWGLRAVCSDGVVNASVTVIYSPSQQETPPAPSCSLGSFSGAPNPANNGSLVTLNWTTNGAVSSVTLLPPTGSPFGVASSGAFQYNAGSYDPQIESWGISVSCIDSSTQNGNVTITVLLP